MGEARLIEFYGGPLDGQRISIPREVKEVRVAERTQVVNPFTYEATVSRAKVRSLVYRDGKMHRIVIEPNIGGDAVLLVHRFDYAGRG